MRARRRGTKQLRGHPELKRVHAGRDYVIVYTILEEEALVLVVRVGHRREAYRRIPGPIRPRPEGIE